MRAYLLGVYTSPKSPVSFMGIDKVYKYVKSEGKHVVTKKQIHTFLKSLEVYSTHVRKKREKFYYKLTSLGGNKVLDVDSAYFDGYDDTYKRMVVLIDTFSKKLAAKALKDIRASTIVRVLPGMIKSLGGTVALRHDGGGEYVNGALSKKLKAMKIKSIRSFPRLKSSAAERVIQTLKSKLFKSMQARGTRQWHKLLPDVVASYNNSKHKSLLNGKLSPNEVTPANTPQLWFHLKKMQMKGMKAPQPFALQLDDAVRIVYTRKPFEKDFEEKNSTVVYLVCFRYRSGGNLNRYRLKDEKNQVLPGSFSLQQLEQCVVTDDTPYRIDDILGYKTIRGVRCALIRWFNMPSKYDSYVPAREVESLQGNKRKQRKRRR